MLPDGYERHVGWNWTLKRMLAASGMFEISTRAFPPAPATVRHFQNWSLMQLGDMLIGLDTWDTFNPTNRYLQHGLFAAGGPFATIRVVIKIQYYKCHVWEQFEQITGIPVRPWVVMPNAIFPLECFRWSESDHRYLVVLTGRNNRFGRQAWVDWCAVNDRCYTKSDYASRESMGDYTALLRESRWGLILKGVPRFHDGKNRRECEFTSCGLPLAMNYQPTYGFPMVAGEHFVLLKEPHDLACLQNIDPRPYAAASRQLYADHFSPVGMAKTLLSLVESL
jgi:hypothetical protein